MSETDELTAIDIALNGIAWALKRWPDDWEHQCFHRVLGSRFGGGHGQALCSCGRASWLSVRSWESACLVFGDNILRKRLKWRPAWDVVLSSPDDARNFHIGMSVTVPIVADENVQPGTVYVVSNVNTSAGVVTLNCKTDWWES